MDRKLNLRAGHTIAVVNHPHEIDVGAPRDTVGAAAAVLLFAINRAELDQHVHVLVEAAGRGALAWLAYPKAKRLHTDLNRDIIHDHMRTVGLDAVRQVAIDDTWSALRFKAIP